MIPYIDHDHNYDDDYDHDNDFNDIIIINVLSPVCEMQHKWVLCLALICSLTETLS